MNDEIWLFVVIYNLLLFTLIGFSVCYLHSPLPLLAIMFSLRYTKKLKQTVE